MLELYNTMSRAQEVFKPLDDKKVKIFTCGPSIYRRPHVGNYRTFLWEDVLQRYLEFLGYDVERVINFTGIEDKAISEAKEEGRSVHGLTDEVAGQFFADAGHLRIKLPGFIPRSSTSVDQAVRLLEILLEKGHAYRYDKDIFFDPLKFEGFGKLFRLDMSRWPKEKRRFRRDTYPGRRWNLGDFILWHGYTEGDDIYWDTEIGRGRPSWNIQDPAMITKHLGFQIDIACGGIDNLYRHHDYNIAVIEAVSGKEFARYWMHGEHLLSQGKKMSKSRGNIIYPEDLFDKGFGGRHVRFYLIYGHHGKTMNMTTQSFREKAERLDRFKESVNLLTKRDAGDAKTGKHGSDDKAEELIESLASGFQEKMDDNLHIKQAFDAIENTLSALVSLKQKGRLSVADSLRAEQELRKIDQVLQVIFE